MPRTKVFLRPAVPVPASPKAGLPLLLASLMVIAASCNQDAIAARWPTAPITIDGDQSDWQGALHRPEGRELAVGVMNDDAWLYVTFSSPNQRTLGQIVRGGFTLWLDPTGRQRKLLGLRYPIGTVNLGLEERTGLRSRRDRPDPEVLLAKVEATESAVEVIGPARHDLAHVPPAGEGGIQVALGWSPYGRFVYELRIPLAVSDATPHAVGAAPGQAIALGFEAGGLDARTRRPGGGLSGSGGLGGGRGGLGRPGGGRGALSGGGRRGDPGQPIDHWVRVTLAAPS